MGYEYVSRVPTAAEHRELARAVGWDDHFDWPSVPASLAGSLAGVVAIDEGAAVGMGRVVGDGVHYFYLQDVIVHPDHTAAGVGTEITRRLLEWIAATAPSRAVVGLFASEDAESMYRDHGFDTAEATGMLRFVEPGESIR